MTQELIAYGLVIAAAGYLVVRFARKKKKKDDCDCG
jgi:hypothetical protein